jgi:ubiquitin carboxyl-terminal hydrolase 10
MLLEVLPPVLVLHLKRFLYDAAADGIVKISKPVRFAPELEIPLGMIFSFVSPMQVS